MFLFIALLSAYLFMHSSFFNVTQIKVTGNEKVTSEEILALSGLTPGINIFSFDERMAAKSIEVHPMIKRAQIKRHLLSEVAIDVIERQVWAVIPYNGVFLCVDDDGVCFDKLNNVPVENELIITLEAVPDHVNLGQTVNAQAAGMIKQVWQALGSEQQGLISEVYYQNQEGTLKIYTLQGTEVRFGDLERLDEKVKAFREILGMEKAMHEKGIEKLEYVDLRFKGEPVVKTRD